MRILDPDPQQWRSANPFLDIFVSNSKNYLVLSNLLAKMSLYFITTNKNWNLEGFYAFHKKPPRRSKIWKINLLWKLWPASSSYELPVKYFDFLMLLFHQNRRQPKFQPSGNIELPCSPYSLNAYSGWLGARSTSVEKAIWTWSRTSMLFLIAARIWVKCVF